MPRKARVISSSGIYHIILRGINQQLIFEDYEDNRKFLNIINEYKAILNFKLLAYCLMGNHVHLLIKIGSENINTTIKRISTKYVYWYNCKYQRCGHLFQDRFKSEPVEDEAYLLTVLRYIHQNPIKANMVNSISDYTFCSYNDYFVEPQFADTEFVLGIINRANLLQFHSILQFDKCLEVSEYHFRTTDEQAYQIILKISKCKNISEIQNIEKDKRNLLLVKLKNAGLSIRQISRLTGISKGIIERAR